MTPEDDEQMDQLVEKLVEKLNAGQAGPPQQPCSQRAVIEELFWGNIKGCNYDALMSHLNQCHDCTEYVQNVLLPKQAEIEAQQPGPVRSFLTRLAIGVGALAVLGLFGLVRSVNNVTFRGTLADKDRDRHW